MGEHHTSPGRVGRMAVRGFAALVLVNAAVAIVAVLVADGEDVWRVVGTTMLLTAACVVVAANATVAERGRLGLVPHVSATAALVAIAGLVTAIWAEDVVDRAWFWKTVMVLLVVGAAGTYAGVLALPALARSWVPARWTGWAAAALLASFTVVAIVSEDAPPGEVYAIVSIVLAAASVLVVVGAVLLRRGVSSKEGGAMTCPRCAAAVAASVATGEHRCPKCGLAFTVHPQRSEPVPDRRQVV